MMSSNTPLIVKPTNLSQAWAELFLRVISSGSTKASTVLLTLTDFSDGEAIENLAIREALDDCLSALGKPSIHTVANTIFPVNLWMRVGCDRHELYEKYLGNFSRIKSLGCQKNDRGTYFQRLIAFGGDIRKGKRLDQCNGNQLEHIISGYLHSKMRYTMLQASIFDPHRDHTISPRLGFPCLQHLQFVPDQQEKTLTVNAYYATQQILEKAYGNYLGICRLGGFMAREMKLSLNQVNFFIGIAKLDTVLKKSKEIVGLKEKLQKAVSSSNSTKIDEE
jgi:hypothetical protein